MERKQFYICAVFDTETCNYGSGADTRAYPILWIMNDIRGVDLFTYEPDTDDNISFYRHADQALTYICDLIQDGLTHSYIPIVCAYNLMFDLQGLMYELNQRFEMVANAQSSTNTYTVDILDEDGNIILRFWDTFHLEQGGLAAMGRTCGLAKAKGDWDYSLVRTPDTPLTELELYYAKRDVQVIPMYLSYLLHANPWMKQDFFGVKILTKTSIVRQMATNQVGNLKFTNIHGRKIKLAYAFEETCRQQLPYCYDVYSLRKACFLGGYTFTSGSFASRVIENVLSLDVTSMHHAFINGRYMPVNFKKKTPDRLKFYVDNILNTPLEEVLTRYHKPFHHAIHARIKFTNLHLKEGSCFEKWNLGLIPQAKFKSTPSNGCDYGYNERAVEAEKTIRSFGWYNRAKNYQFAFGKLLSADVAYIHVNEIELYAISLVYDWDDLEVILGEGTQSFIVPPDYVTLQSNILFETKQHAKFIDKHYKEGEPYTYEVPDTIPPNIAEQLKRGELTNRFFSSYYNCTVKGMFNGIYGTQAQDIYKPTFTVVDGELKIDKSTSVNAENFSNDDIKHPKVFYNYGMRIVGGSRLHLVIAMVLMYNALGSRIDVTGGDTDSMKIRCDSDVKEEELMKALEPLHKGITKAIDTTMRRVRTLFPDKASSLSGVGCFEIENAGNAYKYHMEAWNKARVSIDRDNHSHVTCAGLSRPAGTYHIETFIDELVSRGEDFKSFAPNIIGYNVYVDHDISHSLMKSRPHPIERFNEKVTDYLGNTTLVDEPQAIALYPVGRWLGETTKTTNALSVQWLRNHGVNVDTREKSLEIDGNCARVKILGVDE